MINPNHRLPNSYLAFTFRVIFYLSLTLLVAPLSAQKLPNKIRGYKVYQVQIPIQTSDQTEISKRNPRVLLDSFDIDIGNVSLTKTVWEVRNEFTIFGQSGTVDFISFKDFRINGIDVEIEEYRNRFSFRRDKKLSLTKPIRVILGNFSGVRAGIREISESKKKWRITGRAFVFGRFKKSIFRFKRVIPVDIDIEIDSPIRHSKKKD